MPDTATLDAPAALGEMEDESALIEGAMIVRLRLAARLSRKGSERFCADNSELRIEQTVW